MGEASFQFKKFKIRKSLFEIEDQLEATKFSIDFKPSGIFDKSGSEFELNLEVSINNNEVNIFIVAQGHFVIEGEFEESDLSNYFFVNAPAIVFPYVRAYISTLSTLSGRKAIILPTLNLSGLRKDLEENTTTI